MIAPSTVLLSSQPDLSLVFVKRSDERYKEIRDRHYVANKGAHAQQLHFLVNYKDRVAGIISAGSAAYAIASRDLFFGICKDNRDRVLNGLIDNTVFRLEYHEPNLATRTLAQWRKISAKLWKNLYGVPVYGFETFIVEEPAGKLDQNGEVIPCDRTGHLYKADNWTLVGETSGSTKVHSGLDSKSTREDTIQKLIWCKWVEKHSTAIEAEYKSSWRAETPEEKQRAHDLTAQRRLYVGARFFVLQGRVYYTLLLAFWKYVFKQALKIVLDKRIASVIQYVQGGRRLSHSKGKGQ